LLKFNINKLLKFHTIKKARFKNYILLELTLMLLRNTVKSWTGTSFTVCGFTWLFSQL